MFRVKFSHGREEKLQHKKTSSELSPNICNSTQSTGAEKKLRFILIFPRDGKPECQAGNFVGVAHHRIFGHECARFLSTIIAFLGYRALGDLWVRKRKIRNLTLFAVLSNF